MSEQVVRLEVADGIGTIVLDRPKMNALDAEMQRQLVAVADEAATRDDVKAVIVWGGERVFAAGADVKEMAEMSYTDMAAHVRLLQRFSRALASIPKPTVAAITGFALGGGLETALCCDFRVVADNAKLGLPEITLGIIPGAGGTQRLPRLVGPAKAKELIFSGRFVDAAEALEIGPRPSPNDVLAVARLRRLGRRADVLHAHGLRAGALAALALISVFLRRRFQARRRLES